ncbi:hypothetical protein Tco_0585783 [Tanacetum coccineum]
MPTEMELTLEQTQQGVSHEVSNIRVNLFTMKMEILLESISNKLMVGVRRIQYFSLKILVKEDSSQIELSDHRSSSRDSRLCKMVVEVPGFQLAHKIITHDSYPTNKHKVIMKAQDGDRDCAWSVDLKRFKILVKYKFKEQAHPRVNDSTTNSTKTRQEYELKIRIKTVLLGLKSVNWSDLP